MMNHAMTVLLFSSLSFAPTLAFAENNNDFKHDINATSLGTRMSNAFADEEKKTVSADEVEAARLEEVRLARERDAYLNDRDAQQRRAAVIENRKTTHRTTSVRSNDEQRRLDAQREAAETRSATVDSKAAHAKAVATGAAAGLTADDQSRTEADVELTRMIRQDIMKQDLSMNAKNVKIITIDGVVTLKGHVNNLAEKQAVSSTASAHAGAAKVRNELIVQE